MAIRGNTLFFHFSLLAGLTALLVLVMVYPFLPGAYDRLGIGLSTMVQVFGVLGVVLVPIGGLWLAYEIWHYRRLQTNRPTSSRGYTFALVSLVAASLVALALAGVAYATIGISLGLLTLGLWLYLVLRLIPRMRVLKNAQYKPLNPVPFYLIIIPMVILIFQILLAAPLTASSRTHAITMSADMINDIEAYRTAHGQYPASLLAVWKDYYPDISGIEKFQYEPSGEAYNLVFEQPRFLFDNIGTREFVVYNPLDEQTMISHDSWIMFFTPDELGENQGWYEVHDASVPHWKYFWFD